jgi:hypothetical protein
MSVAILLLFSVLKKVFGPRKIFSFTGFSDFMFVNVECIGKEE